MPETRTRLWDSDMNLLWDSATSSLSFNEAVADEVRVNCTIENGGMRWSGSVTRSSVGVDWQPSEEQIRGLVVWPGVVVKEQA